MDFLKQLRSYSKPELRALLEQWLRSLRDAVQANGERALVAGVLAGMVVVLLTRLVITLAIMAAIGVGLLYAFAPEESAR